MIGILKGMATTMKHALSGSTFTVEYPDEAPEVSARFRGVHKFSQERGSHSCATASAVH